MKSFQSILLLLAVTIFAVHDHLCSAFTTPILLSSTTTSPSTASTTQLQMGLFDRFTQSPEERAAAEAEKLKIKKAKEAAKRLEQQEQLRLQKEIIDRRRNPDKMDEYHALKQERRNLRMEGNDEGAATLAAKIFENVEEGAGAVSFADSSSTPTTTDATTTTTAAAAASSAEEEEVDLKSEYSKEMLKKYKLM